MRPTASTAALPRDEHGRVDLKSLDREALTRFLTESLGFGPGRALRVYKALWQRGVDTIDAIGLARDARERLAAVARISALVPEREIRSADGTIKFLWRLEDGHAIESVLIPDGPRTTLCMSSQVGCAMACTFCLTGDLGLKRHLTVAEIAGQPLQVGARAAAEGRRITNLVLMGMGEPLHNLDNLCTALTICLDDHGLNFSHRRVTVSTVGLVPKMRELAARLPVNLAVSLNATTEAFRRGIMPVTRRYPMEELLRACRELPLPPGKRITFEYVLFDGLNDTLDDAARLLDLLRGIPAKVNLIPYNANPDRDLGPPPPARVAAFQDHLVRSGLSCSVRSTRGLDVSAACGQLGKAREQLRLGVVAG